MGDATTLCDKTDRKCVEVVLINTMRSAHGESQKYNRTVSPEYKSGSLVFAMGQYTVTSRAVHA